MSIYQGARTLSRIILRNFPKPPHTTNARSMKRWVAPTLKQLYARRLKVGPEKPEPRSSYLEWNYEAEVFAFGKRLGEEFDRNLLKQALTQTAFANLEEIKAKEEGIDDFKEISSNRELIKEGENIISNFIQQEFAKIYPQDVVKAYEDHLMSEEMLAHVARHMGLTDIILTTEFPVANSTLSDTFKAVVSALNRSQDQNRAEFFVKDFLISQLNGKEVYDIWIPAEPYEYLQNVLKTDRIEPRLCNESASNTILANFQVGLFDGNKKLLGIGWGESIDIAKDTAALDAIERFYNFK